MKKKDLIFMPVFYDRYINLVPDDMELISGLKSSQNDFHQIKNSLEKYQNIRYERNKWTPKEILQHVIDNEIIQSYRALAFSRNDISILPGYNQDLYIKYSNARNRSIEELLNEFKNVRTSTISLFKSFTTKMYHKEGICSGISVTPLALGFINIGHAIRHVNILNERYFQ